MRQLIGLQLLDLQGADGVRAPVARVRDQRCASALPPGRQLSSYRIHRCHQRPLNSALPDFVRSNLPAGDVLSLSSPVCCPLQPFPSSCPWVPTPRAMAGDDTTPLLDVGSMQNVDDVVAVATPEDLVHHRSLYDLRPGGWGRDLWFYWCNEVRCAGRLWRRVGRERGSGGGFYLVQSGNLGRSLWFTVAW